MFRGLEVIWLYIFTLEVRIALFGEGDIGFKKNPAKWIYVTYGFCIKIFGHLSFWFFLCFLW